MRGSLTDRYDRLAARGDELAGLDPASASPVHVQTVDVLTRLLEMGEHLSSSDTPAPLRALLRMLRSGRSLMLEQLAAVPPDAIRAFMGELVREMQTIVDTPDGAPNDQHAPGRTA